MNYSTAKSDILTKRAIGATLVTIGGLFWIAGALLFFYSSLDGSPVLSALSKVVKTLVATIYEKTSLLAPIWNNAPIPDPSNPLSKGSIGFFVFYFTSFVGASFFGSANTLARRVRKIEVEIEDEIMRASIRGGKARSRQEIEHSAKLPNQPVWKEVHTLYIAPLIVGFFLWLLAKI